MEGFLPYIEKKDSLECYPLLSQGPCDPGSWLILDKNQPNKAICTEELCTPEYDIDHVFYNAKCQDNHDLSICPPHQELLTNAFGEGMFITFSLNKTEKSPRMTN